MRSIVRIAWSIARIGVVITIAGCSPYHPRTVLEPKNIDLPDQFERFGTAATSVRNEDRAWWKNFDDPKLQLLMEKALVDNLSLSIAWRRLREMQALTSSARSGQYPQVDIGAGANRTRVESDSARFLNQVSSAPSSGGGAGAAIENEFVVRSGLSLELDVWKRVASAATAADFRAKAAEAEFENTALLLSGLVTENWFRAQELKALLRLLKEQREAGKTQLELVELRFSVGRANALDVLQQRQQLNATNIQIPSVQAEYDQVMNTLALLCGDAPGNLELATPNGELPGLPEFPSRVTPIDLFLLRPELRAAQLRAQAEEYQLASTIAERFPRLTLGLSYDFSTQQIETLFSDEVGRIASNLVLPVLDGGRRKAQVRQQEHVAKRFLLEYSESFLKALKEVDDALSRERSQKKVLKRVDAQVQHARNTLRESQARYLSGLGDYLPVLVAIQALQEIERRQISEKRAVLVARARLYRALGGYWMKDSAQAFENRGQQEGMPSKRDSNEGDPS